MHIRVLVTTCFFILAIFVVAGRSLLIVDNPQKRVDAIVLLAGSYEERAPVAATLFREGYSGKILLNDDGVRRGWSREHQRNLYSIERSETELVTLGVPMESIVRLPFRKSGTIYDALAVREYVVNHNIRSILLVTSDYHTRRSFWIFRRVMGELPVVISVAPARAGGVIIHKIALEYLKLVYYMFCFGLITDPLEL